MSKKILHISFIIIAILFLNLTFIINNVNADSVAGINCPSSVNLNENFSVALILPSNAYAAEANVSVKFSDGSTSSAKIVYVQGMSDFPNSVTLNAKVAGTATITVSNIIISDSNSSPIENGGSKSQSLNVVAPTLPTTPANPTDNNNSNNNNNSSSSNTTNNNTTTTTVKFTEVNETVYTTERCNIRESYSTNSNKIATVNKNTELKRIGVGDNGWSKVEYNGKTCYVSSQYLTTTQAEPEFTTVNETMYATQSCNLRASWSTDSDKVGYLDAGQEVTRIGVGDNGWSKINYNGKEVYVATRLLQSEPLKEEEEKEPDENTDDTQENTVDDELATIKEKIGVLPEVGNNIAVYIYTTFAVVAVAISLYGIYYTNKK